MAVTEQTNATFDDIAKVFADNDVFAICGHVSPDGDCLGSQLALAHSLRAAGKTAVCLLAKDDPIELGLSLIPGAHDLLPACDYCESPDVFIACDVPNLQRLGDAAEVHGRAGLTVTIDHHAVPVAMSDLNYIDPDAPATAMIVWELLTSSGLPVTADVATCAFTGLLTDTGGFQFQNTNAACFQRASEMVSFGAVPSSIARNCFQNRTEASLRLEERMLDRAEFDMENGIALSYLTKEDFEEFGAAKHDAEPLINVLRSVAGVKVACILRDQAGEVRGSLRAKDDTDVSEVARRFGGGGHIAAAGFTYEGSIEEAVADVKHALMAACGN